MNAAPDTTPALRPDRPMRWRDMDIMLGSVGKEVKSFVAQELGPLLARLAAAEAELERMRANPPTLCDSYLGVWQPGEHPRGAVVTMGGSLWLCFRATTAKPGAGDDWKLIVKRGADGRDLRVP